MRAAARLVAVLGAVAIAALLFRAAPRDVTFVYDLGPGGISSLEVEIRRGGELVRHAEFRLGRGEPRQVRHPVRLRDGEYVLGFRYARAGTPARAERTVVVDGEGTIVLSLAP